ncbi:predicted protein [Paecilomyces variotii No. 5]|uniref:Uncharacterized protein n=1 Tax=Byssochlamys spectabilis (strain No. 5 / NBRC 109023) TaxID=1356009 RepID=V5FYK7_BYSSN|nr:predicted protein [Paecilomyces variotii No. 5]
MGPENKLDYYFTRKRKRSCSIPKAFNVKECPSEAQEVVAADDAWRSNDEYKDSLIGNLDPGPAKVKITARVTSIYDVCGSPSTTRAAKGYFKIAAKDNTGSILIHLWYITADYKIGIGSLLTIWAPHVSPKTAKVQDNPARVTTSLFPERDRHSYVIVHPDTVLQNSCRVPIRYTEYGSSHWLTSLEELRGSARSGQVSTILVLVKVVGNVANITNRKGHTIEKVDIGVRDESGEAILTLYGVMMLSSRKWTPLSTVLLVSRVRWKPGSRLSIMAGTTIEVDPDILEAQCLRKSLRKLSNFVNYQYTEDIFDTDIFESAVTKLKFTLADIDESCNMPVFSNFSSAMCCQCGKFLELSLNPQVIGALSDETGNISSSYTSLYSTEERFKTFHSFFRPQDLTSSPILWSHDAWRALLGAEPNKLLSEIDSSEEELGFITLIQSHLLFLRMTIIFRWSYQHGKLLVCRIVP